MKRKEVPVWDTFEVTSPLSVLDREMYSEAEAARLLKVSQSTLHYWLEGGERRGVMYKPVIRPEPTGSRVVTWAEFVEAALLRQYRKDRRIPMAAMRDLMDELRVRLGVPYPLAHKSPWISGKSILEEVQDQIGLDGEYRLVARQSDQLLLTPASMSFLDRVTFRDDVVGVWRPHDEENSPVVMDPDVRFGRRSVHGISTSVLWEHHEDGETPAEIAEVFGLKRRDVYMAISYEAARAA